MKSDPIVDEVHQAREAISKQFDGDLRAICDDARRRQSASDRKVRRLPPRPARLPPAKAG